MSSQPTFTWINSKTGSVSSTGLYTAPAAASSDSVSASSGGVSGSTPITIAGPSVATAASASLVADPGTIQLSGLGADPSGESTLTYTWTATSSPSGSDTSFYDNGENSAKDRYAYVDTAGTYTFLLTISDGTNSVTSSVSITLSQTATSILLAPGGAVANGKSQLLSAVVDDQFGNPMAVQPTISWSVPSAGAGGTITSGGLYSAASSGTGTDVVQASASGLSATSTIEVGAYVGRVFFDPSGDGEYSSTDEGLSGFTVYDDLNGNGSLDSGEQSANTDAQGYYALPPASSGYGACQMIAVVGHTPFTATTPQSVSDSGTGTPAFFGFAAPAAHISANNGTAHRGEADIIVTVTDSAGDKVDPGTVSLVSPPAGVSIKEQPTTGGGTLKVTIIVGKTPLPVTLTLKSVQHPSLTYTTTIN